MTICSPSSAAAAFSSRAAAHQRCRVCKRRCSFSLTHRSSSTICCTSPALSQSPRCFTHCASRSLPPHLPLLHKSVTIKEQVQRRDSPRRHYRLAGAAAHRRRRAGEFPARSAVCVWNHRHLYRLFARRLKAASRPFARRNRTERQNAKDLQVQRPSPPRCSSHHLLHWCPLQPMESYSLCRLFCNSRCSLPAAVRRACDVAVHQWQQAPGPQPRPPAV